jgi:uncharacterized SAM-binding protein YcdF (DUF218 family)
MRADAVMVLGKELLRDPERARRELMARAAAASVALRHGATAVFALEALLKGQERSGSRIVCEYLEQLEVPAGAVVAEERTRSTREEAWAAAELIESRGIGRLVVVTASYHVPRARMYFGRVMDPRRFEVVAPENFLQRSAGLEREWILAGTPAGEALEREERLERVLTALGAVAGRVPLGGRVEAAAAALMRRAPARE